MFVAVTRGGMVPASLVHKGVGNIGVFKTWWF